LTDNEILKFPVLATDGQYPFGECLWITDRTESAGQLAGQISYSFAYVCRDDGYAETNRLQ
jgi:hypothetical protein